MPLYRYRAMTAEGRLVTGEYSSDSVASVRQHLLSSDLFPQKIARSLNWLPHKFAGRTERLLFIHSFELLLASGVDAVDALEISARKIKNRQLHQSLNDIVIAVRNGRSLADAFFHHVETFGDQWIAALKAGEASGDLKESVHLYRQLSQRLHDIKQKVSVALTYPLILIGLIVIVLTVLLTVVVPRLSVSYSSLGGELPQLTQWILFASDFFPYLASGLILLLALGHLTLRHFVTGSMVARLKRRFLEIIPLLGKIGIEFRTVNVSATLSMLLLAGHSLHDALRLMATTEVDVDLAERLFQAAESIEKGHGVVQTMTVFGLFPDTALQLLEAGEQTGELGHTLKKISRFHLGLLDLSVSRFMNVLEPILMLFIGLVIGVVVIAVYLPIFSMTQVIG